MKGVRDIELVGVYANWFWGIVSYIGYHKWKTVRLRFTVGAFTEFQEYVKSLDADMSTAMADMKHLQVMLSIFSAYGGKKAPPEDFGFIGIDQIHDIMELVEEAAEGMGKLTGAAPEKKP